MTQLEMTLLNFLIQFHKIGVEVHIFFDGMHSRFLNIYFDSIYFTFINENFHIIRINLFSHQKKKILQTFSIFFLSNLLMTKKPSSGVPDSTKKDTIDHRKRERISQVSRFVDMIRAGIYPNFMAGVPLNLKVTRIYF